MSNGEINLKINEELTLTESKNGLTFGTDAFLLSAFAEGGTTKKCADLGSGTGVIPLLCIQKNKFNKAYAVEIQEKFAEIIKQNAEQNGLSDKVIPLCADIRQVKPCDVGGELDVVTANPPYMTVDSGKRNEHDEKFIARHEVHGDINDFCACAYRLLKHGGKFYTVWRPDRLCDLICALRANRLEPKVIIFVHATTENEPSMVLIQSTKGAASGARVLRPLILHDSGEDAKNSKLSADAAAIYESCSFKNFK